jgi:hypothetical protein
VILRSGNARFTVRPKRLGAHVPRFENVLAEGRYRLRVVFPRAGRWSYTVLDGTPANLRFRFPPALVGGNVGRVAREHVAFPEEAAIGDGPLPPEVVRLSADGSDRVSVAVLWILAGLPFAGAGILALHERRRPSV